MILDAIAAKTRVRIERLHREGSLSVHRERALAARTPHAFDAAFASPGVHVIAEIKFASPSEGNIRGMAAPDTIADEYLRHGATALSILTEPDFFGGSLDFLAGVRARFPDARLLQKDFILDEAQICEARIRGADAILLIVRLLDDATLRRFLGLARELGLGALVETHDEAELARAEAAGATLVGVNNRDLDTLKVSLDVSRRLAKRIPAGVTAVSESGIHTGDDIRALRALGYRAFLVGTTLMRAPQPGAALAALREGGR